MNYSEIFNSQKLFFDTNQTKNIDFRISALRKLKTIIKNNEQVLYDAVYKDFAKSKYETYETELSLIYHEINLAIRKTPRWAKIKRRHTNLANFPGRSYQIPEPLGVSLIIGAWNYPLQLTLIPLAAALSAGCTAIVKPSELSDNTAKTMSEIFNKEFPSEFIYFAQGSVEETKALLSLPFDKIFFTGSVPVGKIVYEAAAKNLTPVTLELGGKSPAFVLSDCDLKMSAKRIVWAKFLNAGQTCVAPDYLFVERSIFPEFLEELKRNIDQIFPENDTPAENYVRIINQRHFDRLCKLLDPDKIVQGGKTNREKLYISPTVLTNVDFSHISMQDEIFGPILPVLMFENLVEAISQVKNLPKPLALYVYANNKKTIRKILHENSFGGGAVNDSVVHLANSSLPFGGVGSSGIGNYHGNAGFDAFTHYKSILKKSTIFEPYLKYPPYTTGKLNIIKKILE